MSDEPEDRQAEGEGSAREPTPSHAIDSTTPFTQQVGRAAMLGAAILFVVFALANFQYVDFSWVFGSTEVVKQGGDRVSGGMPLIVLLGVAFGLGVVVGTFGAWRRGRRRARVERED